MVKFSSEQVRDLRRPGVYIYRNETGTVLYVGATCFGVDRAFDHNHRMYTFEDVSLEFIPCSAATIAFDLESVLIHRLRPANNRRKEPCEGYGQEVQELAKLVCGD